MTEFADLILRSGRSGVELALFVLLPIMIVMLTFMRILEAHGILDWVVKRATPLVRWFGIPGLGLFALIQVVFVGVAAPLATLAMMDKSAIPRRQIAATLAMVFGAAQANVTFPMAAFGVNTPLIIGISILGALIGAASTYYIFGRSLNDHDAPAIDLPKHPTASDTKGILEIINGAGREAFNIAVSAIPMLVLALLLVNILRSSGAISGLETLLMPLFNFFDLSSAMLLPLVTKAIAGGTAMMGVMTEYLQQNVISLQEFHISAALLITPFDVAGVAILISAGPRVASVLRPAAYGAVVAIIVRTLMHYIAAM